MRNCRNIIQKITRDRLSFILLYFGMGLILFSLVKSLGIKAQLDDLTNYEGRYDYKYDGCFAVGKECYEDDTDWDAEQKLCVDMFYFYLDTLSKVETEETALVYCFVCDGMIESGELYYVISDKRDEKYLKKYMYCNDRIDAYISRDMLEFTYVRDGIRYIDIEGRTLRIGGEYTAADFGGRGKVVILRNGLSEDYKEYFDRCFYEVNNLLIGFSVEIKSNRPLEDELKHINRIMDDSVPDEEHYISRDFNNKEVYGINEYDDYVKLSEEGMCTELIFSAVNFIVILFVWIKRRKKDIAIRRIFGQKPEIIALIYLKEVVLCMVLAVPLVIGLNIIYSFFWDNIDISAFSIKYVAFLAKGLGVTYIWTFINILIGVRMVNVVDIIREE
ncbi:hypothetical protein SAMN04487934_102129 [Eubacterium ruminantium]|nr:hypothetical protein SAMN04487934_102129 [Eubacterium ruminantium]